VLARLFWFWRITRLIPQLPLLASGRLWEMQVLLISLQRLGDTRETTLIGSQVLALTRKSPWEHALLRVTLGTTDPAKVLERARDDGQRCQALYYLGARLRTVGKPAAAGKAFTVCLEMDTECLERHLAEAEIDCRNVYQKSFGSPEAGWQMHGRDFPEVVTMDAQGRSLHADVAADSRARLVEVLKR
jgi:hypothetical protein